MGGGGREGGRGGARKDPLGARRRNGHVPDFFFLFFVNKEMEERIPRLMSVGKFPFYRSVPGKKNFWKEKEKK